MLSSPANGRSIATELAEPAAKVLRSLGDHWNGLTVFVSRPWVPMDNNPGERVVRPPVVGRKGFYGSGAEPAEAGDLDSS